LANLTAILYANSYGVSMCFIFNELDIWRIFKKDKKGLHDLSVWQRHSNMKHMKPCGKKFKSHDLPTVHWTVNSLCRSASVVQSAKLKGSGVEFALRVWKAGRAPIRYMLRFHGYPSTFSDLWRQVGSVTTIRKLFVLGERNIV
jgi:hypothetical protein